MNVMFPRDVLNREKWTGNPELSGIKVWYVHRGAPNDQKSIGGEEIIRLEHSFMVLLSHEQETKIPYHRILKITRIKQKDSEKGRGEGGAKEGKDYLEIRSEEKKTGDDFDTDIKDENECDGDEDDNKRNEEDDKKGNKNEEGDKKGNEGVEVIYDRSEYGQRTQ